MIHSQAGTRSHRIAVAFLLLVTLVTAGCDAGALPVRVQPTSLLKEKRTCVATNLSGECLPRGGSGAVRNASQSTADALQNLGVVGGMIAFKNAVGDRARSFWKDAERTKFLLAGAVAGIVSRTCVSPLEVIATVQMITGGSKGLGTELSELFKNEGFSGFFKGNAANCLKVAPTRGIQFFAFESFKTKLVTWKRKVQNLPEDADINLTPIERLIAGGFAGMIASSLVYPIEVVKTMLTMYPGKYTGIGGAFTAVINEAGIQGLFQGLWPTLLAMFPYVGVEFMIYETSKIALEATLRRMHIESEGNDASFVLPTVVSLGLGAFAGAAAQTTAHPLDVVRKRLQIQGLNGNPILYKNTFDCFAGIVKKEGIQALYKGLGPACVATIPGTGIAYITYETMKKVLGLSSV